MKSKRETAISTSYLDIIGNTILALIKGITGVFGNSYALIADAIESTTDIFSSIILLIGIKYSTKKPDENHPYGHGKAEPLITFIIVGFLLFAATAIAIQSIKNIQTPHESPKPYTLVVLAIIIIIKEGLYRYVKSKGVETNSTVLLADAWHHRSDAITSLMAFLGISFAIAMGPGYENADDFAALVASGIIIFNAFRIFRPALGEIMDEQLYDELILDVRMLSKEIDGVIGTEKCFIRKAGMMFYVDLHVVVDGNETVRNGHDIAHMIKNKIREEIPDVADVLIHIEPN